ncbi:hypothetical protein AQUCO_03800191v1 [Aquilegia coerulea]|uniref:Uncharacterized protein n=1 Tax=Aquilegia coerulea TaxID=218851 RepID=A0A2G5CSY7_AQUCA|nr:hypothetical protein AQUCO_03800191v1 [Aquilegia coerulea]
MASISSLPFTSIHKVSLPKIRYFGSNSEIFRFQQSTFSITKRFSNSSSSQSQAIQCKTEDVPTVAETKLKFLKEYKRPIPSVYNTVLQELIVQQHLISDEDRDAMFKAYVHALNEDPEQYRLDAQKVEEWARSQNASSIVEFSSKEGEIEEVLKDISERAASKGSFSYSRFFAVGLFRILELAKATNPAVLEKLCAALNVDKRSVDRDLDVYRNLLSKLCQAKELLKEYVNREKKKREERAESQKANGAMAKFQGEPQYTV